jgi:hypothetical protein
MLTLSYLEAVQVTRQMLSFINKTNANSIRMKGTIK